MKKSSEEALHDELSFFYAQITPHFLYNTFNAIIGLSYKDTEKAREALQHLAVYFRAKLDFYNRDAIIPLKKEIDLVKAYVKIEKRSEEHTSELQSLGQLVCRLLLE